MTPPPKRRHFETRTTTRGPRKRLQIDMSPEGWALFDKLRTRTGLQTKALFEAAIVTLEAQLSEPQRD